MKNDLFQFALELLLLCSPGSSYPGFQKDRRQEDEGTTEDEMVGWHHQLSGYEFEWAGGVDDGRPWGHKESDTTEQMNWSDRDKKQISGLDIQVLRRDKDGQWLLSRCGIYIKES